MPNWYILGRLIQEADKEHQRKIAEAEKTKQQMVEQLRKQQLMAYQNQLLLEREKELQKQQMANQVLTSLFQTSFKMAAQKNQEIYQLTNTIFRNLDKLSYLPQDVRDKIPEYVSKGDVGGLLNVFSQATQLNDEEHRQRMSVIETNKFLQSYKKEVESVYKNFKVLNPEEQQDFENAIQMGDANKILYYAGAIGGRTKDAKQVLEELQAQHQLEITQKKQQIDKLWGVFLNPVVALNDSEVVNTLQNLSKEEPHLFQLLSLTAKEVKEGRVTDPVRAKEAVKAIYLGDYDTLKNEFNLNKTDINDIKSMLSGTGLNPEQILLNLAIKFPRETKGVVKDFAGVVAKNFPEGNYNASNVFNVLANHITKKIFKTPEEAYYYLSNFIKYVGNNGEALGMPNFEDVIEAVPVSSPVVLSGMEKGLSRREGTTAKEEGATTTEGKTLTSKQKFDVPATKVYYRIKPSVFNYGGVKTGLMEYVSSFIPQIAPYPKIDFNSIKQNNQSQQPTQDLGNILFGKKE